MSEINLRKCSVQEMHQYVESSGFYYEQGGVRHSVLCAALRNPNPDVFDYVLGRNVGLEDVCSFCSPVCYTAMAGGAAVLRRAIAAGANPHERDVGGDSMLHYAVLFSAELCNVLLDAGVDINVTSTDDGAQPLHWAVGHASNLVIQFLLARGADPHARDHNGYTPLSLAPKSHPLGEESPRSLLLQAGAGKRK